MAELKGVGATFGGGGGITLPSGRTITSEQMQSIVKEMNEK